MGMEFSRAASTLSSVHTGMPLVFFFFFQRSPKRDNNNNNNTNHCLGPCASFSTMCLCGGTHTQIHTFTHMGAFAKGPLVWVTVPEQSSRLPRYSY